MHVCYSVGGFTKCVLTIGPGALTKLSKAPHRATSTEGWLASDVMSVPASMSVLIMGRMEVSEMRWSGERSTVVFPFHWEVYYG